MKINPNHTQKALSHHQSLRRSLYMRFFVLTETHRVHHGRGLHSNIILDVAKQIRTIIVQKKMENNMKKADVTSCDGFPTFVGNALDPNSKIAEESKDATPKEELELGGNGVEQDDLVELAMCVC